MNINTFIFDLGGVIIDLDTRAQVRALRKLSGLNDDAFNKAMLNSSVFIDYEVGSFDSVSFRNKLRSELAMEAEDDQIDSAWNAILLDITKGSIELLTDLRKNYKIVILSNTNSIHIDEFNKKLELVSGHNSLDYFADHVCLSHELNMRKPDGEIYTEMLRITETNASESLFLDDREDNLAGAESVGINTLHIKRPVDVFNVLKYAK